MKKKFFKRIIFSFMSLQLVTMSISEVKVYAQNSTGFNFYKERKIEATDTNILTNIKLNSVNLMNVINKLEVKSSKNSPQEINTDIRFYVDKKENMEYRFSIEDENGINIIKDYSEDNFININYPETKKFKLWVEGKDLKNLFNKWIGSIEYEFIHEPLIINETNLKFTSSLIYNNKPKTLVLHHIEASKMSIDRIHKYHISRGWSGIGYHYFVDKEGNIFRGRPEKAVGAHCPPKNFNSISIAVEGTYMKETMPEKQKKAVVKLGKDILERYSIKTIGGHGDFYKTDCPGTNFPLEELRASMLEK